MEFKNYLLDIIKRYKGIEKSSDICVHGINPIIKELYTEIKRHYPHSRKFLIKKLKSININLNGPCKMSKPEGCWRLRTASKKTIDLFYQEVPIRHIDKIKACEEVGRFSYDKNRY